MSYCQCVAALGVTMSLLESPSSAFDERLFVTSVARSLDVAPSQVVVRRVQPLGDSGSSVSFDVQPTEGHDTLSNAQVQAHVKRLETGAIELPPSFGPYVVATYAMPPQVEPEDRYVLSPLTPAGHHPFANRNAAV